MKEVPIKTKLELKHKLESEWIVSGYVPIQSEPIVYDIEVDADGNTLELPEGRTTPYTYERMKLGDGIHNVNDLPFSDDPVLLAISEQYKDFSSPRILFATPRDEFGNTSENFKYPDDYAFDWGTEEDLAKQGTPFTGEYFLKRLTTGDPDLGIIMKDNRDAKVAEGLIWGTGSAKYIQYEDHDEPYKRYDDDTEGNERGRMTVAMRDNKGRLVAEDAEAPFHVVNKRQLDKSIETVNKEVNGTITENRLIDYQTANAGQVDYFVLNEDGFVSEITNSSYDFTRRESDDSMPFYPLPYGRLTFKTAFSSSFYGAPFYIPNEIIHDTFSMGFWVNGADISSSRTFKAAIWAEGAGYIISFTQIPFATEVEYEATKTSGGYTATIKIDKVINSWGHFIITVVKAESASNYGKLRLDIGCGTVKSIDSTDTGISFSVPVMTTGILQSLVPLKNISNPNKTTVPNPVNELDAVNLRYITAVRNEIEENNLSKDETETLIKEKFVDYWDETHPMIYDLLALDDTGFTGAISESNYSFSKLYAYSTISKTSPLYPKPVGCLYAKNAISSGFIYASFSIPIYSNSYRSEPNWEKTVSIGFWMYNKNISSSNTYKLGVYNNSTGKNLALFSQISFLKTENWGTSNGGVSFIVDKIIGDWSHITMKLTLGSDMSEDEKNTYWPHNNSQGVMYKLRIGGSTMNGSDRNIYFTMPTILNKDDLKWYVDYPNESYMPPKVVGRPESEDHAVNKKYFDENTVKPNEFETFLGNSLISFNNNFDLFERNADGFVDEKVDDYFNFIKTNSEPDCPVYPEYLADITLNESTCTGDTFYYKEFDIPKEKLFGKRFSIGFWVRQDNFEYDYTQGTNVKIGFDTSEINIYGVPFAAFGVGYYKNDESEKGLLLEIDANIGNWWHITVTVPEHLDYQLSKLRIGSSFNKWYPNAEKHFKMSLPVIVIGNMKPFVNYGSTYKKYVDDAVESLKTYINETILGGEW